MAVISDYQYDDGEDDGSDLFMREPYGVLFSIKNSNGKYTSCNGQSFEMAPKQQLGKKDSTLLLYVGKAAG